MISPIETAVRSETLVSNRFSHITTRDIITALERRGFQPLRQSISRVQKSEREGYQKHMLTFTHPALKVDDGLQGTLMVRNGNDGTAALGLYIGVFRSLCENQLVAGAGFFGSHIYHNRFWMERFQASLDSVIAKGADLKSTIDAMRSREMDWSARQIMLEYGALIRLKGVPLIHSVDYKSFNPIRSGDLSNDLWTVYNRVQERVVRGGIRYQYARMEDDGTTIAGIGNGTTRAVRSIAANTKLNTSLWTFAERFLKSA